MTITVLAVVSVITSVIWYLLATHYKKQANVGFEQQKLVLDNYKLSLDKRKVALDSYKLTLDQRKVDLDNKEALLEQKVQRQIAQPQTQSPPFTSEEQPSSQPLPNLKELQRVPTSLAGDVAKNKKLQQELMTLLRNDAAAASRLFHQQREKNSDKTDTWCLEKVINDLQRDRH